MTYDLLIIGGGINGCAIAREAALNGLRVLLVERDDLASHTSSASTGLIHGGLRYLEQYDFRLVAEALRERERLIGAAPHLIRPMLFVLPHEHAVRPWWMVRAGLVLYDLLGGRMTLPRSRGLRKSDTVFSDPLKGGARGFVYSDAQVDDARLTLANALDAAANGAEIATRTALVGASMGDRVWQATLSDGREVTASAMVNAAGPWVEEALGRIGVNAKGGVRLVKGSHIVVPKLYDGDHAYMLQQPDRRIVFAIPYNGMTEIGTTDVPVDAPEDAKIDADEIAYLCNAANRHFVTQIAPEDVVATWSGVRPLYDDGASEAQVVSRDYVLELRTIGDGPPLLSVFGGKITTARHLAEEALAKLAPALRTTVARVTRTRPFPGGDIDWPAFLTDIEQRWPFLGSERAMRMAHAYGATLREMLAEVHDEAGMGRAFGAGLTEIELNWMRTREWAQSADDALTRRSKLGLKMTAAEKQAVADWFAAQPARRLATAMPIKKISSIAP